MIKLFRKILLPLENWAKKIVLPFFDGLSLYQVSRFFIKGIAQGKITNRAASISWSFFLALFPGIIFLFSLIAFFPIVRDLQEEVFMVFKRILPPDTYEGTRSTIEDILKNRRPDLLSFGFLFALIFATNGINALVSNFNHSIYQIEKRKFWKQQLVSIGLTTAMALIFVVGIVLIVFSSTVLNAALGFFGWEEVSPFMVEASRLVLLLLLALTSIALLYNVGATRIREWRFISPGAVLATFLILLSSGGFSFYVSHFSQYNKLYGSIGTLIVIMLWIYINAIVLLIGFELNASIIGAKNSNKKKLKDPE